jgi:hypothetical protein
MFMATEVDGAFETLRSWNPVDTPCSAAELSSARPYAAVRCHDADCLHLRMRACFRPIGQKRLCFGA